MVLKQLDKRRLSPLMREIANNWLYDEKTLVENLAKEAKLSEQAHKEVQKKAADLVTSVRKTRLSKSGLDAFMAKYDLSSEEGIVLMCLAEALLRIPDKLTADKLIKDKLTSANWQEHLGDSEHLFVNAATWCLMLTGKILKPVKTHKRFSGVFKNFLDKRSRPVIRRAVMQAMKILGQQYVMGETIEKVLKRAKEKEKQGFSYSYDMLGEAAVTMADADFYDRAYQQAIEAIGKAATEQSVRKNPGISVKLSALHPRYELAKADRVHRELYPKLLKLVMLAKAHQIGLNIDAEESERLELSLTLIARLAREKTLAGFEGIGIVVQAYQKRAGLVLDYLIDLAKDTGHRFMIRLVKGAYWDAEIKQAQVEGLAGYPVFTRKCYTDVAYQACVKKLFANVAHVYPQFATHNAYTVAMVMQFAGDFKTMSFSAFTGWAMRFMTRLSEKPMRFLVGFMRRLAPISIFCLILSGACLKMAQIPLLLIELLMRRPQLSA